MFTTYSNKVKTAFLVAFLMVFSAAGINYNQSIQHNNAKLPKGLETQHKFLKWIDRWKDRYPQVSADSFKKIDDGEIISSNNPRYTVSDVNMDEVRAKVDSVKEDRYSVVAPDKLQYLSFRQYFSPIKEATTSYVYYYGIRDNKVLSGPIYECKKTKCYFDRPFFQTPDLFYIAEVQEKINPQDPTLCERAKICAYELFLHEFDLKANNRNTYVSDQLLTDFKQIDEALNDL